jgi:hypothetical protein
MKIPLYELFVCDQNLKRGESDVAPDAERRGQLSGNGKIQMVD